MKLAIRSTLLLTLGVLLGVAGVTLLRPPVHVLTAERSAFAITPMEAALEKPIPEVWIDNLPLTEAAAKLSAAAGVAIEVDLGAMSLDGASPPGPVTLRRRNISFSNALDALVSGSYDFPGRDYDWCVVDGRVIITSSPEAAARDTLVLRSYDVKHIVAAGSPSVGSGNTPGNVTANTATMENLVRIIKDSVGPPSGRGPAGDIKACGDQLVISQTFRLHAEVRQLLSVLAGPQELTPGAPTPDAAGQQFHPTLKRWVSLSPGRGDERLQAVVRDYSVTDMPLGQALHHLATVAQFDLVLAPAPPEEFPAHGKVTLAMKHAPAWRILRTLLDKADTLQTLDVADPDHGRRPQPAFGLGGTRATEDAFTWWFDGAVVVVGPGHFARLTMHTRVYDIRDVLSKVVKKPGDPNDELILMIERHVAPDSWRDTGGYGSMRRIGDLVVIQQTAENHRKVQQFVAELISAKSINADSVEPPLPSQPSKSSR